MLKCDRCGAEEATRYSVRMAISSLTVDERLIDEEFDLCDECRRQTVAFLWSLKSKLGGGSDGESDT